MEGNHEVARQAKKQHYTDILDAPSWIFIQQYLEKNATTLPRDLIDRLRQHARYKQRTSETFRDLHYPLLSDCIEQRQSSNDSAPHVILLGDGVLFNFPNELSKSVTGCSQAATASDTATSSNIIDLTIPGDSIRNVLHRLGIGLFDQLHNLLTSNTLPQHDTIILQIGTHDLPTNPSKSSTPKAFTQSTLTAFTSLLSTLLKSSPSTRILVTALLPRRDIPNATIHRANTQLQSTTASLTQTHGSRLTFLPSPLGLTSGHLETNTTLNASGCAILAASLKPALSSTLSPSQPTTGRKNSDVGEKTSPHASLRPAQDILNRILHDADHYDPENVVIGYEDRHEGIQEIKASQWIRDSDEEFWVPMHRIRWFAVERDGGREVVWDRVARVDAVFGSGGGSVVSG